MRKFILLLLLALLSVSNPIYAKGEEIIKIEVIDNTKPGTKTNRIPAKPQERYTATSETVLLEGW